MSVRRALGKVVIGGVAALALSGAGQAFAAQEDLNSETYGARAWSEGTHGQVAIQDTVGDSHSVYSLYDRLYHTGLRINNTDGHGHTVYSDMETTNYVRKVTACVNIQLKPDVCGPDDRPGDGH